jgi:hypothetical protein
MQQSMHSGRPWAERDLLAITPFIGQRAFQDFSRIKAHIR